MTGVDNLFFEKNTLEHLIKYKNFSFHKFDVREDKLYKEFIPKNDVILPLAGIVGAPLCDKFHDLAYEINENSVKKISENISKNQNIILPPLIVVTGLQIKMLYVTKTWNLIQSLTMGGQK